MKREEMNTTINTMNSIHQATLIRTIVLLLIYYMRGEEIDVMIPHEPYFRVINYYLSYNKEPFNVVLRTQCLWNGMIYIAPN